MIGNLSFPSAREMSFVHTISKLANVVLLFYQTVFCFMSTNRSVQSHSKCYDVVYFLNLLEFTGVDSFSEETMPEDYEMESSSEVLNEELEEGEVLQDAELVCVNQEDMDRIDAAEGS
jgi:hypothetical protein